MSRMSSNQASWLPFMLMGTKDGNYNWWMIILIILTSIGGELFLYMKKNSIYDFLRSFFTANQKVYSIKADITKKNNIIYGYDIPLAFYAIMYAIEQKVSHDPTINYTITERALTHCRKVKLVQFNNRYVPYSITDDISIMIDLEERLSDRGEFNFMTFTIEVMSQSKKMANVMAFIDKCIEEYDEHQESICKNKLKVFTLTGIDKETEQKMIYHEMPFETTKTFDTMYFAEKEMLLSRVSKFEKDKMTYQRLGIPYTLGMLFSGKPGTGKTSAIKALAQHSQRHIIRIPVKLIGDSESLQMIFLSERINNYKIPMDKRLYVFEEIDCTAWQDVVISRKLKNPLNNVACQEKENPEAERFNEIADSIKQLINADSDDPKKMHKPSAKTNKTELTLGDLLDILDGIVEMPGRMIVMTSNHPDRLDEALLRPGRIDVKIEFKSMRKRDINDMFKLWFGKSIPEDVMSQLCDYQYTQADIGSIFSLQDEQAIFRTLVKA